MKTFIATTDGLRLVDTPRLIPKPTEILVRTRAIGVNRIDLHALANPTDQIIGMEWSGEVVEVGAECQGFSVGDRVMGTGAAAYAEYVVTDYGRAVPIPKAEIDWGAAAASMLGLQTMHDALVTRGKLRPGHAVLVQGAASVMGLIGMQIAKALGAGVVLGTSGNADRRGRLKEFGCDVGIDSSDEGWPRKVLDATDGKGADVVVDNVSGTAFNKCMAAAALEGRLVNVGRLGGATAAFDFNLHALRRLEYTGVTFRTRTVEQVRTLNSLMLADLQRMLVEGGPRVPIAGRFSFDRAAEALDTMRRSEHFGKLVLEL
ncbi:quinone oxidoreductase family protein [Variovorax paradoxus]|uniref:Phthiocerol synthesis polyketide synthase type I PpsC n=1 Tax=Variovorax paradoxus TaxID=34073 RepID=A0A0H2M2N5_VARPD|nr:zinc-binding dehydrogenase [Variovorax paradoxus]KLN56366.1 phthiocerol synthesis polyketide synthase type I PpsC [Variovorax paradoxus]